MAHNVLTIGLLYHFYGSIGFFRIHSSCKDFLLFRQVVINSFCFQMKWNFCGPSAFWWASLQSQPCICIGPPVTFWPPHSSIASWHVTDSSSSLDFSTSTIITNEILLTSFTKFDPSMILSPNYLPRFTLRCRTSVLTRHSSVSLDVSPLRHTIHRNQLSMGWRHTRYVTALDIHGSFSYMSARRKRLQMLNILASLHWYWDLFLNFLGKAIVYSWTIGTVAQYSTWSCWNKKCMLLAQLEPVENICHRNLKGPKEWR